MLKHHSPKRSKIIKTIAIFAFICGILIAIAASIYAFLPSSEPVVPASELAISDTDEIFGLEILDENPIKMQKNSDGVLFLQHLDRPVLFIFFTSDCPPCQTQLSHINTISKRYDNLKIVALLAEDIKSEQLKAIKSSQNIAFPISVGTSAKNLAKALNIDAVPASALFDANGKNAFIYTGLIPLEMLEYDIKKVF